MSNIDKQAVQAVADLKAGYTLGHADVEIIQQMALDAVTLLDELEAAEKRIAELSASHGNLREAMAGIHNTITAGGAYTPLAAILNASKRAYEESAAAAGKGE
ncbi:hypothetical protein VB296_00620 [Enterobacter cloacae]|uniref:hypothetical protein n=1 Tax=Enterobacter cloacae TaxID=550 RepID=UPI0021D1D66D|nr:hypothetical protein [Enterobacter cloacae]MEA5221380.1 hypothetical protein [Enterobacter cloacae]